MYDLNRVKMVFDMACLRAGVVVDTNCIKINDRLTSTHGRVTSEWKEGVGYVPTKVEFSKQMLDCATDESIKQVVLHEAAHYIVSKRTHADHGHDAYFKSVCREIGCTKPEASGNLDYVKPIPEPTYKYFVVCPNCGVIGKYQRKCKTITSIGNRMCKKCKSTQLRVVAN